MSVLSDYLGAHYNANSLHRDNLTTIADELGFRAFLAYGDLGYADVLHARYQQADFTFRPIDDIDSWYPRLGQYATGGDWLAALMKIPYVIDRPWCRWCSDNEPGVTREYIQKLTGIVRAWKALTGPRPRLAIGLFSVASWSEQSINDGWFDELLHELGALETPDIILTVHEYAQWRIDMDQMSLSQAVQDTAPQAFQGQIIAQYQEKGALPEYNHIGRAAWFYIRARKIGAGDPWVRVDEGLFDNCPDLETGYPDLCAAFWKRWNDRPYKIGDFTDPKIYGARQYASFWKALWPEKSFAQAYLDQIQWYLQWMSALSPRFLGLLLFMWNDDWGWEGRGYNVDPVTDDSVWWKFWRHSKTMSITPDTGYWYQFKASFPLDHANVRTGPGVSFPLASFVIPKEPALVGHLLSVTTTPGDRYSPWFGFATDPSATQPDSYVSDTVVDWMLTGAPMPDAPSELTRTGLFIPMTDNQILALQKGAPIDAWHDLFQSVYDAIKNFTEVAL